MVFMQQLGVLLWKDLRLELRSREVVYTSVFFALLVTVISGFAFLRHAGAGEKVAPGILWIALTFSGTLGMNRTFGREREDGCLQGVLLAPVPRPAVFLGKLVANFVFMATAAAAMMPLVALFFEPRLFAHGGGIALCLALGTLGFAAVGTLLSAGLSKARLRHVLLPIVMYPLTLPAVISGVMATTSILAPGPDAAAQARAWLVLLGGYDVVFLAAAIFLFDPLVRD
jgi:heme exporter protein B